MKTPKCLFICRVKGKFHAYHTAWGRVFLDELIGIHQLKCFVAIYIKTVYLAQFIQAK
jgi:hypothetical protein